MPEVNFYLQKPKAKPPKPKKSPKAGTKVKERKERKPRKDCLIYLQMKYSGERLFFFFNQSIDPDDWNIKKQRAKSNTSTTADGKRHLNDLLKLQDETIKAYNELIKQGIPAPGTIKARLQAFMNQNDDKPDPGKPGLFELIQKFIDNDILYRGRKRKESTTRTFKTTLNHLKEYANKYKVKLTYESIDLDFYNRFVKFLIDKGLNDNSRGKYVKDLKTAMSEAVDLGYTNNLQFKHKKFVTTREDVESVYLTWEEILKLYQHDFSSNLRLERSRDLFVFGCCVCMRYSDYSRVKPENIIEHEGERYIRIKTQKTGEPVILPCHPLVLKIFKKYQHEENNLPKAVSGQKFNAYIKEVCKAAGLTETGRLESAPGLHLYECVSSHTARRSGLTNYYLEGFPTVDLTKISGHKTEKAFLNYIKVSKLDVAKRLGAHIKKNWSEKLLRVAS